MTSWSSRELSVLLTDCPGLSVGTDTELCRMRMQAKEHQPADSGGSSSGDSLQTKRQLKSSSCFSNIKIFLISECALMLAQGTVGAYLVSGTQPMLPSYFFRFKQMGNVMCVGV